MSFEARIVEVWRGERDFKKCDKVQSCCGLKAKGERIMLCGWVVYVGGGLRGLWCGVRLRLE